jgi:hypothetical protein
MMDGSHTSAYEELIFSQSVGFHQIFTSFILHTSQIQIIASDF